MAEVVATANQSNFMSRQEMLQWINDALKLNEKKIENLGTGAIFCQLFDMCYPGKVQMSKVNWKAKYENEYVANFKILQQAFDKMQVNKPIDVNKLIKCKYQDNLEFLQWMRKYHDQFRKNDKPYDAVSRRNGQVLLDVLQDKPQPHLINHASSIQTNQDTCASSVISASSSNNNNNNNNNNLLNIKQHQFLRNSNKKSHTAFLNSAGESNKPFPNSSQSSVSNISMDQDSAQIEDNDGKIVEQFQVSNNNNNPHHHVHIQHQGSSNNNNNNNITDINILDEIEKSEKESCVKKLRDERDFVMEKLKSIDQLLDGVNISSGHTGVEVKRLIKCILYATNDNLLTVLDDGSLTITDSHMQEVNANSFENFQGLQRLQQEILQTDANLKAIKQKHKKQQVVFDPNQENRQLLPPTYPINSGISQIAQQQLNLGTSGNNYDSNLAKSAGGNNQAEKNNGITAISLNIPQQQQTSLFNKESGFKTPQSGKYSYEQALQLDDFSSSISSNTNANQQTLQLPQQSQQPPRKNSTPLYEILVNDENISKPKIVGSSQQQEGAKGVSFAVPGSAEGMKSTAGQEVIKIQPVKQEVSFPKQDVFEKLSDNLFDAQDEDLLGNLE